MDIPVVDEDPKEREFRLFLVNEGRYVNSTIREIMKYYRRINRNNITDDALKNQHDKFSCEVREKIRWVLKIYNEYQSKKNLKDKI
jgi:hypothetical protein